MRKPGTLSIALAMVAALKGCAAEAREPHRWRTASALRETTPLWRGALALRETPPPWRGASALRASFHHVHINDAAPDRLVQYYERLFDPSTTRPVTLDVFPGVEAGGVYLLITPVKRPPKEEGSAGWHFGWGTVSLEEAYDRHRMQEIGWDLPLPSFATNLHLHLESENPKAAGEWYRDRFGAALELSAANAAVHPVNAWYRRPAAIARLDGVALAIYKAVGTLESSRGHRIDHIAFAVPDLVAAREALSAAGVKMLDAQKNLGPHDTVLIEGPDRLAIELIGPPVVHE